MYANAKLVPRDFCTRIRHPDSFGERITMQSENEPRRSEVIASVQLNDSVNSQNDSDLYRFVWSSLLFNPMRS